MADQTHTPIPFLQPWHLQVPPQDDGPQSMEDRYGSEPVGVEEAE